MNRYIKTAAAVGTAITLGACATSSGTPPAASAGVSTVQPGLTRESAATLTAMGGSGITGSAAAVSEPHQTHVTVSLGGAMAGAVLPWHIHSGQCGSNGPIVGPPASYPPMTAGSDGAATGAATLPMPLEATTRYYVNIHKSPTEMGTIVACGDLVRRGM